MVLTVQRNTISFQNWKQYAEPTFHILVWGMYFASINVKWTGPWIAEGFLPDWVAPHFAIAIPTLFLLNVYWWIPTFLRKGKWPVFLAIFLGCLVWFELARAYIFYSVLPSVSYWNELTGENSLVFGKLNVLTANFIFWSFIFRFTRDWFYNQSLIERLTSEKQKLLDSFQLKQKSNLVSYTTMFHIKKHNGNLALKISAIVCFKAQGDFVLALDHQGRKHIINDSLKNVKAQLNPQDFFQINRSEIIHFTYFNGYKSHIKNRLRIDLETLEDPMYTSNSRTPQFRNWIRNR
ncbi:MAG: LytTR family transcriptional regulator [Flavobacteriaceae bacterium]|nr:LytTR family transcriptional regulator [Flavobacteriaceae bacterium]